MDTIENVNQQIQTAPSQCEGVAKKSNWLGFIQSHFRRIVIEIVNFLFNHDWLFWLIGLLNKKFGFIESLFLVYPASEKYGLAYAYSRRLRKNRWVPYLSGLLRQNGKIVLMFSISAYNGQFRDSQNGESCRRMVARMEHLRQLVGAKRKTFAGILPGVLFVKRLIREAPEADLTATAVIQAIEKVKQEEFLDEDTPIIVLGGKGFIGRRVVKLMPKSNIHSIDIADGQNSANWPSHLFGQRVIVLNITLNSALKEYTDLMWPGTVVINEVYPEPSPEVLEKLGQNNCACYHVVGVEARAIPSFPTVYQGAIPCCAAWPSENMKVSVRRIN